ncbi:MAG: hypothetical protein ACR2PI_06625 [Hyphomicrobiaceae bacterium]
MSDKCKTLMHPARVWQGDVVDGVPLDEFRAAAPPPSEFGDLAIDQRDVKAGETVFGVSDPIDEPARDSRMSRRLAALVHVEVATGSPTVVHCGRAMRAAWRRLWAAVMCADEVRQSGIAVAETATTATFEFASAVEAVRWAARVQELSEAHREVAPSDGLRLRISIGVGEVHDAAKLLRGSGLNDPMAISCFGRPGGILTTTTVLDLIRYDLQPRVTGIDGPETRPFDDATRLFALNWQSMSDVSSAQ